MVGYDWPTGGSSGNSNVDMIMNVDGSLSVRRGGSAVLGTIPAVAFPLANTWYYVEAQVRVHNTLGFVNVRINGNQVLTTAATLDTLNSTLLCDSVRLGEGGSSAQSLFDDLYIAAWPASTRSSETAKPRSSSPTATARSTSSSAPTVTASTTGNSSMSNRQRRPTTSSQRHLDSRISTRCPIWR